jgi:hypothetical protein
MAHALWAVAFVVTALMALRVGRAWVELRKRSIELADRREKQVEELQKRFEAVEKTANALKTEWFNTKAVRGIAK